MLPFLTLDEAVVTQKKVLVRGDLNVPLYNGHVTDTMRIERLLPTLNYLAEKQARIVLISHFGRPQGQVDPQLSLHPVHTALSKLWGRTLQWGEDCIGKAVQQNITSLRPGEIILLENLRFHAGEEENDSGFAQELASLVDLYVNDAFSCSHRTHASVVGVTEYLPAFAGFSLKTELEALSQALETPQGPVMAIVGGSKISTKLALLKNLLEKVDILAIGGGMANTFLAAKGYPVGLSRVEVDLYPLANEISQLAAYKGCQLLLPEDVVTVEGIDPQVVPHTCTIDAVSSVDSIVDIGPQTLVRWQAQLAQAHTLVWNGPVGIFEIEAFAKGTLALAQAVATATQKRGLMSVAGGGDTVAALHAAGVVKQLTYVSTAGGAFLEWLEGKILPGITALSAAKARCYTLNVS
jgi:phosphoglycerate kinase